MTNQHSGFIQLMIAPDRTVYMVTFSVEQQSEPASQQQQAQQEGDNQQTAASNDNSRSSPKIIPISAVAIPQEDALGRVLQQFTAHNNSSSNSSANNTLQMMNSYASSRTPAASSWPLQPSMLPTPAPSLMSLGNQPVAASGPGMLNMSNVNAALGSHGPHGLPAALMHAIPALSPWNPTLQLQQSAGYGRMIAGGGTAMPAAMSYGNMAPQEQINRPVSARSFILYNDGDSEQLSEYQCLLRKQIQIFEATQSDVDATKQGRNKPIKLGQVGIRCRHCASLPPRERKTGAAYFPSKLPGIYQTAQHMAVSHFLPQKCNNLDSAVADKLVTLKQNKSSSDGGRKYWTQSALSIGVIETSTVLRFSHP